MGIMLCIKSFSRICWAAGVWPLSAHPIASAELVGEDRERSRPHRQPRKAGPTKATEDGPENNVGRNENRHESPHAHPLAGEGRVSSETIGDIGKSPEKPADDFKFEGEKSPAKDEEHDGRPNEAEGFPEPRPIHWMRVEGEVDHVSEGVHGVEGVVELRGVKPYVPMVLRVVEGKSVAETDPKKCGVAEKAGKGDKSEQRTEPDLGERIADIGSHQEGEAEDGCEENALSAASAGDGGDQGSAPPPAALETIEK